MNNVLTTILAIVLAILFVVILIVIKKLIYIKMLKNDAVRRAISPYIGQDAYVVSKIEPGHIGEIEIDNSRFRAKSLSREEIPVGSMVKILHSSGYNIIVQRPL